MIPKYKFWCQACGVYLREGEGPCTIAGHRSERLYFAPVWRRFVRYTRPVVTEATEKDGKVVHLGVRS